MDHPKVSIITPCYNAEKYIAETIQSVLDQTFTDWELLITDDHSSDHSVSLIKQYADPRIRLFSTPENAGAGAARNVSLENAKGQYIAFIDSDDVWESNYLEEMIGFLESKNEALVYCNYARCDENLKPVLEDFKADIPVTFNNILKTCRLFVSASIYDSSKSGVIYFPKGSKREDHVMWLNLLKKIPDGKPLAKTLVKYRMREGSVSRKKTDIMKDQYLVYRDYMGFSFLKSWYYTANWAFNGFLKYSKRFN